jgi:hypothetical protein
MKKLPGKFIIIFSLLGLMISCKKNLFSDLYSTITTDSSSNTINYEQSYSTLDEFRQAIANIAVQLDNYEVVAYLDTLENGYPDPYGRKEPLSRFAYAIVEKLGGNDQQVASAVDDVFHFDGSTFSLISYIMKAHMVNNISRQISDSLINQIPLPPIAVDGFDPPMQPVIPDTPVVNCCDHCKPSLDILVTSVYVEPCGNRSTKVVGHAGKGLSGISKGAYYRFDGEIKGCNCPGGKWNNTIQFPNGGVMGSDKSWIGFTTFQSGDNIITLSYTVCGITVSKTFVLSVN